MCVCVCVFCWFCLGFFGGEGRKGVLCFLVWFFVGFCEGFFAFGLSVLGVFFPQNSKKVFL